MRNELRTRPMVFVADLDHPELEDVDRHHLERSLRVRSGDPLTICDGFGRWRPARFGPRIEPDGETVTGERPTPELAVGFAPVKGDRSDLAVQKLTELGIDRIVPLRTERSVVRWDEARATKNLERHRRIAREAAMQSRNLWPPTVEPLVDLSTFLAARPAAVLADPEGEPLSGAHVSVAIGPEGGFSPAELSAAATVALPGRILRTETAAITAAALMASHRGNHSEETNARRG